MVQLDELALPAQQLADDVEPGLAQDAVALEDFMPRGEHRAQAVDARIDQLALDEV
jgi:hypothetical protein